MAFGKRAGEQPTEERALQVLPWGDWNTSGYGPAAAGVPVSPESASQLLVVYGCVSLISDTIATLPRCIYRQNSDGTKTEVTQTPRWLDAPNSYSTMIEFITQSCVSLLLDGNAYWTYEVDRNLTPTTLHVVAPNRIDVRSADGLGYLDNGSGVSYYLDGAPFRGKIIHIKGITRPGALKGMSPIEAARQAIGLGLAAQEYASRFFSNGASLSGVIETPMDLTLDQAKDTVRKFAGDHAGVRNAHKPGLLDNGAHWSAISVTPEQAQFLQSREYQDADICAKMFLLDPSVLSIAVGTKGANLTYANLEQRGIHLATYTLMRWIVRLEQAFSQLLPKPQSLKFDMDGLKRADLETRGRYAQMALGGPQGSAVPWQTVNEIRQELFDLDPMDESELPQVQAPAQPLSLVPGQQPPTAGTQVPPAVNS